VGENRGKVFPGRSRVGAPPGRQKGKAADAANVHGLNGVTTHQSSNQVTLAHRDREIKRSCADWRTFYDNARGNVEHALKELYRAWGNGFLTDGEAAEIENRTEVPARPPPTRSNKPGRHHSGARQRQVQARSGLGSAPRAALSRPREVASAGSNAGRLKQHASGPC